MMLDYSKQKKSFGLALLLTIMFGCFGIHRFYLGHWKFGLAYLAAIAFTIVGIMIPDVTSTSDGPIVMVAAAVLVGISLVVLIEICLSYWVVGRENNRIKARLSAEYGVLDYKV